MVKSNQQQTPKIRCHEVNHEPIEIGGGILYGGACNSPKSGYDIYIGFQEGMILRHSKYPWVKDPAVEFEFVIADMRVPKSVVTFRKLIKYMKKQLSQGKKIHIGCIGGHGRTGLVIAALVSVLLPDEEDAIAWTREHHCERAVESQQQVNWLMKYFKVKEAEPTKVYKPPKAVAANDPYPAKVLSFAGGDPEQGVYYPLDSSPLSIW